MCTALVIPTGGAVADPDDVSLSFEHVGDCSDRVIDLLLFSGVRLLHECRVKAWVFDAA